MTLRWTCIQEASKDSSEILFQRTLSSLTPTPNHLFTVTSKITDQAPKDAFSPQWENYNSCWGQESVFLLYCESWLGSGYCLFFLQLCLFHISCGPLWGQLFDQQLSSLQTVYMYFSHPILFCPLIFIYSPLILLINWLLSYCCPNPCNSCSLVLSYPQPAATFNRNTISFWNSIQVDRTYTTLSQLPLSPSTIKSHLLRSTISQYCDFFLMLSIS